MAATAAPVLSYQIGQYFKAKDTQGTAGHILAHGILAAAVAAAGKTDAATADISAGTAEAAAPVITNWLYGTGDAHNLTAEQQETVAAIVGLLGAATGGVLGEGVSDVVQAAAAAQNAVENNSQLGKDITGWISKKAQNLSKKSDIPAVRGVVLGLGDFLNGVVVLGDTSVETLATAIHCGTGGSYCDEGFASNRQKAEALIELGHKIVDGTVKQQIIAVAEDLMSDDHKGLIGELRL